MRLGILSNRFEILIGILGGNYRTHSPMADRNNLYDIGFARVIQDVITYDPCPATGNETFRAAFSQIWK